MVSNVVHYTSIYGIFIHFNLLNTLLYICKYIRIVLYMYVFIINTHTHFERGKKMFTTINNCLFTFYLA